MSTIYRTDASSVREFLLRLAPGEYMLEEIYSIAHVEFRPQGPDLFALSSRPENSLDRRWKHHIRSALSKLTAERVFYRAGPSLYIKEVHS